MRRSGMRGLMPLGYTLRAVRYFLAAAFLSSARAPLRESNIA
jgi:hypothetical protein